MNYTFKFQQSMEVIGSCKRMLRIGISPRPLPSFRRYFDVLAKRQHAFQSSHLEMLLQAKTKEKYWRTRGQTSATNLRHRIHQSSLFSSEKGLTGNPVHWRKTTVLKTKVFFSNSTNSMPGDRALAAASAWPMHVQHP